MSSLTSSSAFSLDDADAIDLAQKLKLAPERTQLQLIQESQQTEAGLAGLMRFLKDQQAQGDGEPGTSIAIAGAVYQALLGAEAAVEFLQVQFPQGVVPLRSQAGLDYAPLQKLLAQQDFLAADKLTLQNLCELASPAAVQRKWLYFTEVGQFPSLDLQTINALWLAHSGGKFGFSVQREIWLGTGKDWEKLWVKIGWKSGNIWTRYPQGFTWDLTAPRGHLPLSNQLRGVRTIAALLTHPAWS
ncbi:MAG TPA: GUN4 N-terminal ARM-like repeat domain-containing protein [Thermosynechococcaceae cyanobacterium]